MAWFLEVFVFLRRTDSHRPVVGGSCGLKRLLSHSGSGFSLADVRKKLNTPSDQYFTARQLVDLKIADHVL